MKFRINRVTPVFVLFVCIAAQVFAANKETIDTVEAYSGENGVNVDVYCRNEIGLLEYFNLIVFDDTKLDFVSIAADRGGLWYGTYPTTVVGDHIYVHGVASAPSYCINPDVGDPGSPLFHIVFNVKPGVDAGLAALTFATEGLWDGHWNDCSGYQVNPNPDSYSGGVNVLGHAGHITIGGDSASAGQQAVVDVYMHNDLDVFEYFNQILFQDAIADVDSVVALRGTLHYGFYPTHVAGDTIFAHGWAGSGGCFTADHSTPGAALYRIYFSLHGSAPPGFVMPLTYLYGSPVWNHWVGCDLNTTDAFEAANGSVTVRTPTGVVMTSPKAKATLGQIVPNPTSHGARLSYFLSEAGFVTVAIYDAAGRKIKTLEHASHGEGWHDVTWDGTDDVGRDITSGVYFYRLQAGNAILSKKLVVVR